MKNKCTLSLMLFTAAAFLAACSDNNTPVLSEAVTTSAVTTAVTASAATTTASVTTEPPAEEVFEPVTEEFTSLSSTDDIELHCIDEMGVNYVFSYSGEEFSAKYTPDNWHITDSYLIESHHDLVIICQALIDEHPVHSADMEGYRTAEDMAYEWHRHNIAYALLPEGSEWKDSARDVDLDSKDQNKSLFDFFLERLDKV